MEFFKTIKVVPKLMSDCSGCECAFWTLEKVMPKSKLVSSHLGLIYQSFFFALRSKEYKVMVLDS